MRTQRIAITLAAMAALLRPLSAQNLDVELQRAIQQETVTGNLKTAIDEYKKIVARAGSNRPIAAKALVRMAECYQKMGDTEARKIYEQVVKEYGDQKDAVAMALLQLGKQPEAGDGRTSFRQIWTLPAEGDVFGTISRDGRYLPYMRWDQHGDLFLHDFSTGTDRRLTNTATDGVPGKVSEYAEETSVSRDGRQLAYSWFRGDHNRYELRLIDLKGDGIPQPRLLFDNQDVGWISADDWSPDGKWIAVQIQRTDKTAQIGLVSVPDGSLRVLKSIDWRGASRLVFSPDGKYIAYDLPAGEATEQRDVFVLAADASREIPAAVSPSQDTFVGWSKEGGRLLFASDRSGSLGLWSVAFAEGKIDGTPELLKRDIGQIANLGVTDTVKLYALIRNSGLRGDIQTAAIDFATGKLSPPSLAVQTYVGNNAYPDWSPDGKYLAYASARGGIFPRYFVIGIRSVQTGEVRELSPAPGFDLLQSLAWAPDGQSLIVRGRDAKGRIGIFNINAQTGRTSILVTKGEKESLSPSFGQSPDGKRLYYARLSENAAIWIEKDLPSGNERELARRPNLEAGVLSPDGRYIALGSTDRSKPRTLSLLPVAGGEPRELMHETALGQVRGLGWAPDGSAIYFIKAPGELWRFPVDGSEPTKVDLKSERNNINIGPFRVHPDGRQIVFEVRPAKKPMDVWVLENFVPPTESK
jgi:Tol biopolymer transport system component